MIVIEQGVKLVYHGKELMLPGTVLTVKSVRTYAVQPDVFETMAMFNETGESEYNVRFFALEFHGIKPGTPIPA
jgi:hypothetical protein